MSKLIWEIPCPECGLVVGAYLNGDVVTHPKSGVPCTYIHGNSELHYELHKQLKEQLRMLKEQLGVTDQTIRDLQSRPTPKPKSKEATSPSQKLKQAQKAINRKANKKAKDRANRLSKQEKEAIADYWDKRRSGFREIQGGSPGLGKNS